MSRKSSPAELLAPRGMTFGLPVTIGAEEMGVQCYGFEGKKENPAHSPGHATSAFNQSQL